MTTSLHMFSLTTVVLPVIGPYSRIIVHTASFSLDSANIGMLAMSFILAILGLPMSLPTHFLQMAIYIIGKIYIFF